MPGLANVIDAVSPPAAGVTIQVVASVTDELVVENRSADVLTVPDPDGRPFLRIGPDGVSADFNAPYWYASNSPGGQSGVPPSVSASSGPRWVVVATDPAWGWFDTRLPGHDVEPPPRPPAGSVVRLRQWSIPVTIGDRATIVSGHLLYAPPTGSVRARVTDPAPPSTGLVVQVVSGGPAPAVFASWSGTSPVTVLGQHDEPFIRFSASGVEANLASPTWRAAAQARGQAPQGVVDAQGPPRWVTLDAVPRLSWVDPRLGYGPSAPPPAIQARVTTTELGRWTLPIDTREGRVGISGVTEWVPDASPAAFPQPSPRRRFGWMGDAWSASRGPARALGIAGAVAALAWGLHRRRRAAPRRPPASR